MALPGGDDFGPRPIDMHLTGLEALGATFELAHGYIEAGADGSTGAPVMLEFPSVGATENILMAAVLAKGTTVIDNAAREPEIADLADVPQRMGAQIDRCGLVDDRGRGRRAAAGRRARGDPRPHRGRDVPRRGRGRRRRGHCSRRPRRPHGHVHPEARRDGHDGLADARRAVGARTASACARSTCRRCRIRASPPTTSRSFTAMLAVADGVGIVTENIFAGRFRYVDELVRMGADIRTEGHHAVVRGGARAVGRAGAGARHPRRRRARRGRARAEGETDRLRRRAHRPGLRGLRRQAAVRRRRHRAGHRLARPGNI